MQIFQSPVCPTHHGLRTVTSVYSGVNRVLCATRPQKLVQPRQQASCHLGDARPLARSQQLFDQPQLIAHQPRQQEMLAYMLLSSTPKIPSLARMLE
jgi:hypothetical protein